MKRYVILALVVLTLAACGYQRLAGFLRAEGGRVHEFRRPLQALLLKELQRPPRPRWLAHR